MISAAGIQDFYRRPATFWEVYGFQGATITSSRSPPTSVWAPLGATLRGGELGQGHPGVCRHRRGVLRSRCLRFWSTPSVREWPAARRSSCTAHTRGGPARKARAAEVEAHRRRTGGHRQARCPATCGTTCQVAGGGRAGRRTSGRDFRGGRLGTLGLELRRAQGWSGARIYPMQIPRHRTFMRHRGDGTFFGSSTRN